MARVLIIDDDSEVCRMLSELIRRMGHESDSAVTLRKGSSFLREENYDAVLLDVRMPDGSGLEMISEIRAEVSSPEVIIMTGFGDSDGAQAAIENGAWDYISKPVSPQNIMLVLRRVFQYRENLKKAGITQHPYRFEGITGSSSLMKTCLFHVARAAGSEVSVLLTGETGTGKELIATAIHSNSRRSAKQFVVVDCAALPQTLVESVLFGYEKGAFTGAENSRKGLIQQADGGTLFLDEVGELPLSMQKTFLRCLQERKFRPIGGSREISSDFRLIAATNRDPEQMVEKTLFRKDLLYRISAHSICLPPLRDRAEDIPETAEYHMKNLCENYNIPKKEFSPDFIAALQSYHWPGNVRELVNVLDRAIAEAHFDPLLFARHLPTKLRIHAAGFYMSPYREKDQKQGTARKSGGFPKFREYRQQHLDKAEKEYLRKLMPHAKGCIKDACRIAGISRTRLYNLMKKHRISRLGWESGEGKE
ncbi:MAG: sigma-54 dependent transcriptional regulator [Desulfococcaceae bacterium]|nr:sigma-54 dependent transcriptional regulator [Desulfococcaceae bacterium]